jgi:hypothetical protein
MFVWLGSGRAGRNGVGPKGRLLDEAARARLPVPDGAVVLDAFYRLACDKALVVVEDGRLEIPDPPYLSNTLYHGVRLPRFNRPVIIRPAFSSESNHHQDTKAQRRKNAIAQTVDANDPTAFALALGRVWSAAAALDDTWRRDTLVMEMIQSETSGTAVTSDSQATDRVYHPTMTATDEALHLPQISGWQRPDDTLPPYARRLQQLLRGVRRTFGRGAWNLEWADDGEICRLITVYPTPTHTEAL